MIIKDNKGTAALNNTSSLNRVISYNEKKIAEGVGRILFGEFDDTFKENAHNFEKQMFVKKANGIFMHIPISFHPDDSVNEKLMVNITLDYLRNKNVDISNVVIVEHTDRPHPHVHIVMINKNNQNKYNTSFSKMGSVRDTLSYCRKTEKQFGLKEVKGNDTVRKNYNETNAIKYSLCKAVKKHSELFMSKASYYEKEIVNLKEKETSNDDFKKLNEKAFFTLFNIAKSEKLIYVSRKSRVEQLIKDNYFEIKKDPYNFKHPDLCVEVTKNNYIQYGLTAESYYINDSKLPFLFQLDFLKGEKKITNSKCKIYLSWVLQSCLKKEQLSKETFLKILAENKIGITEKSNIEKIEEVIFTFQDQTFTINKSSKLMSDLSKKLEQTNSINIETSLEANHEKNNATTNTTEIKENVPSVEQTLRGQSIKYINEQVDLYLEPSVNRSEISLKEFLKDKDIELITQSNHEGIQSITFKHNGLVFSPDVKNLDNEFLKILTYEPKKSLNDPTIQINTNISEEAKEKERNEAQNRSSSKGMGR